MNVIYFNITAISGAYISRGIPFLLSVYNISCIGMYFASTYSESTPFMTKTSDKSKGEAMKKKMFHNLVVCLQICFIFARLINNKTTISFKSI